MEAVVIFGTFRPNMGAVVIFGTFREQLHIHLFDRQIVECRRDNTSTHAIVMADIMNISTSAQKSQIKTASYRSESLPNINRM
jgi:hypothetical protein